MKWYQIIWAYIRLAPDKARYNQYLENAMWRTLNRPDKTRKWLDRINIRFWDSFYTKEEQKILRSYKYEKWCEELIKN